MPKHPGHCLLCLRPRPRRWWQRGLLTPLPLCGRGDAVECHRLSLFRR